MAFVAEVFVVTSGTSKPLARFLFEAPPQPGDTLVLPDGVRVKVLHSEHVAAKPPPGDPIHMEYQIYVQR